MPFFIRSVVAVGMLVAAFGCGSRPSHKPRLGEVDRLPRLETIKPELHDNLEIRRTYIATLEPFEKVELCAQVRGVVKDMPPEVDIGRFVKANKTLFTLDIPDILADRANKEALLEQYTSLQALATQTVKVAAAEEKEAHAQLERFEADIEFRKRQTARINKLALNDTVSQQLAEESQLQYQSAVAALSAGNAQVVTKKARLLAAQEEQKVAGSRIKVAQTDLARLQTMVDFAAIKAPFDGIITKRWVDSGATVKDSTTPLLTIMRLDKVRVLIDIPERDVPYMTMDGSAPPFKGNALKGNLVSLEVPALRDVLYGHQFSGTISLMAAALDPVTRTMRTELHLAQSIDDKVAFLRPQMTGTATVVLTQRKAITVPSSALVRSGNKMELYYLADPTGEPPRGVVKKLEVQLGVDDGKRVEVRSKLLTGQEWIIVKGAGVIRAGDQAVNVPAR